MDILSYSIYSTYLWISGPSNGNRKVNFMVAYNTSLVITGILKNIMTTEAPSAWKTALEKVLESFIVDSHRYSIQEREAILSIIEGGEYYGLVYGAHGKTKGQHKINNLWIRQRSHKLSKEP